MGLHKLEIELTDDLISRIDQVSAATKHSRAEVVVDTLRESLPEMASKPDQQAIDKRLAFLEEFAKMTAGLGAGRSQEEIDSELEKIRADRTYDR